MYTVIILIQVAALVLQILCLVVCAHYWHEMSHWIDRYVDGHHYGGSKETGV